MVSKTAKKCGKCGQAKDASEFCKCRNRTDGLQIWCKECNKQNYRKWFKSNPHKRQEYTINARERSRERYAADENYREKRKRFARRSRAKRTPEQKAQAALDNRNYRLMKQCGINQDKYEAMVAARNGCCDLCGRKPKKLVTDHDHESKRLRGLLCIACNAALGQLGDTAEGLKKALAYLKRTGN
jgi:hypothetical protein